MGETDRAAENLGPMARLLGFGQPGKQGWRLVLLLMLGAALPLFALADWRGVDVPLNHDYAVLARLFIALPLLVLGGPQFDRLVSDAMGQVTRAGLLSGEALAAHDRWAGKLRGLRGSNVAEALFALSALLFGFWRVGLPGPLLGLSGWGYDASGALNAAGVWYGFGVLTLLRFLILLWMWLLLLWTLYMAKLAFLPLDLKPAHSDGAAGLGYLGFVQQRLSLLLVVGSFMLAGSAANRIAYHGETLSDLFQPLLIYVVAYPLLLIVPLAMLTPRLMEAKRRAVLDYGLVAQRMARDFQRDWVEPSAGIGSPLESPNPSAMADFGAVHATVETMRTLPIRPFGFGVMVASAVVPLLLLVLLMVPLESLLRSAISEMPPFGLLESVEGGIRKPL